MPVTALAIGAAVGLLKSQTVDAAKAKRERTLAAATQRLSPWTGLTAQPVHEPDPLGSALAFAGTGAQIQGGMAQQDLNKKIADKYLADPNATGINAALPAAGPMAGAEDPNQPWYMKKNPWGNMSGGSGGNYGA